MSQFSKQELLELQKSLNIRKKKLESQIQELGREDPFLDPDHVTDNAAIDTDVREQIGHDTIQATVDSLKREFEKVEGALKRTFDGTYGLCTNCGKPIDKERLNLLPSAEHCIKCHGQIFTKTL